VNGPWCQIFVLISFAYLQPEQIITILAFLSGYDKLKLS
jgi:hypothetical protein